MAITTISSREFNQDSGRAKKAARNGPVYITDRGQPAYVLLSFEEFLRRSGAEKSLADLLAHPASAHLDFDPPRLTGPFTHPVDFD